VDILKRPSSGGVLALQLVCALLLKRERQRSELERFRHREWAPALRAAGIAYRRIYDLRHTYATWSLAAGVDLFTLSRRMGTSLAMIDATYGHLAPDADERERVLLDAYDRDVRAAGR
jgi:integrase